MQRALEGLLESVHQRRDKSEVNVKDVEGVVSKVVFIPLETQKRVRRPLCRLRSDLACSFKDWGRRWSQQRDGREKGDTRVPLGAEGVAVTWVPKCLGMHAGNCGVGRGGAVSAGARGLTPGSGGHGDLRVGGSRGSCRA